MISNPSLLITTGAVALLGLLAGCGGGGTTPGPDPLDRLAGGGRGADEDPFNGGSPSSGPAPGGGPESDPYPGYIPLFFADQNCSAAPFETVITTTAAWQTWWTVQTACVRGTTTVTEPPPIPDPNSGSSPGNPGGGDGIMPEPWDPYPVEAPEVDFSQYAVVAVALESTNTYGRGAWVQTVESTETGTTITYEVSQPGEDCGDFYKYGPDGQEGTIESSPVVAVLVPLPLTGPYTFTRNTTTWNCTWEPDPNEPWTLYYTDASCDLGPNQGLITTAPQWEQWLDAAGDCDMQRWNDPGWGGIPATGIGGGSSEPGGEASPPNDPDRDNPIDEPGIDPVPPPPSWSGMDVDFNTHYVVLLRGETQSRWGGGIWLNSYTSSPSGTVIEYTEMRPGGNCPAIEGGNTVRPTVAIRLPHPAPAPFSFVRHIETIDCDWGSDGNGGGTTPPDEPRPL